MKSYKLLVFQVSVICCLGSLTSAAEGQITEARFGDYTFSLDYSLISGVSIPSDWKATCQGGTSGTCPEVRVGDSTFRFYSQVSNGSDMAVVLYDSAGGQVGLPKVYAGVGRYVQNNTVVLGASDLTMDLQSTTWSIPYADLLAMLPTGDGGQTSGEMTNTLPPSGPISLDGDTATGDQEQRVVSGASVGAVYELELNIADSPEISGWSVTIEFDSEQVQVVNGSFAATEFIPGLLTLTAGSENTFQMGGTVLGANASNSGSGSIGTFSVEILEGFEDETRVSITEVKLNLISGGTLDLEVYSELIFNASEPTLLGDLDGNREVGFSDFFIFADLFGSTDSSADFDGNGTVDFSDFFIFADQFGKRRQAKLMALAVEYLGLPQAASLKHSYPNPFNSETTIPYSVGMEGLVTIQLYDLVGQCIRTLVHREHKPGNHKITWDGRDDDGRYVSTGVYFAYLMSNGYTEMSKLTLIK